MQKKLIKPLIFLISSLTACIMLVVNLFAWFTNSQTPLIGSVEINIANGTDYHFAIISINEDRIGSFGHKKSIWPNDTWDFEIRTMKDNSDFSISFYTEKLSDGAFIDTIAKAGDADREDLLMGPYQKLETLNDGSKTFDSYFDFDIDKCLNNSTLTKSIQEHKIEFLKGFTDNNNIVSAFSARITKINDDVLTKPIPLVRPIVNGKEDETSTVLFADEQAVKDYYQDDNATLIFDKDDVIHLEFSYGMRMIDSAPWMPAVSTAPASVFGQGSYRTKSLNCFIGQVVEITFDIFQI